MRGLAIAAIVVATVVAAVAGCHARAPAAHTDATQFRFSPRPNRAAEIHWRAWGPDLFADARAQKKPILLSLSAIWCHWCHVLDETSLSDERVIATLDRDFIPVRVDADQHPDLERRYLLGGWPTLAVLTADGEIVDGGTYIPPDALVILLEASLKAVRAGGAELAQRTARFRNRGESGIAGLLSPTIVEEATHAIESTADLVHGGFGGAPKFPHGEAIELLLDVGETDLARRALDALLRLEDPVEGGFYRYATQPDWTKPHYEKMLAGNAELLAAYARAFALTHDARYQRAAHRIVDYVRTHLLDDAGALAASQDADEKYYAADAAGRRALPAPYIDRTLLTDRAAQMISSLVAAAHDLDDAALLDLARRASQPLLAMRDGDGRFFHARRANASPEVRGQLADQAAAALAFFDLANAIQTAHPDQAQALRAAARDALTATQRTLRSDDGSYFDSDAASEGLLRRRERPLLDNVTLARAFFAAGDRDSARRILTAFAASWRDHGLESASYARTVRLLGP